MKPTSKSGWWGCPTCGWFTWVEPNECLGFEGVGWSGCIVCEECGDNMKPQPKGKERTHEATRWDWGHSGYDPSGHGFN